MPKIKHFALAGAFFLLLALVFTYPLVLDFTDSIVGGTQGDGIYFVWLVRWYQGFFLGENPHIFFNPMMNYPQGWNLSTTDTSLAALLPSIPFSIALGPVAGFNIGMWLSFVLSGLAMYAWVYRHTQSHAASLVAGTIYAFFPNRLAHYFAGHLNLLATAWFPVYFMALYEVLQSRDRYNWGWMAVCAASFVLIAFTSMYYLLFTIIFTLLFGLGYLLFENRKQVIATVKAPATWLRAGITTLLSAPFVYLALRPFVSLSAQGDIAVRSLDYMNQHSASPTDFFIPSPTHFLFGNWVNSTFDRSLAIESTMYIGIVAVALTLIAFMRRKDITNRPLLYISGFMAIAGFVLALGPSLHWNNQQVLLDGNLIPLPTRLLYELVPFFSRMRAISRIGLFTLLFAAFAGGLGAHVLLQRLPRRTAQWATLALILLVVLDFFPNPHYSRIREVQARPVDHWLAQQPATGAVIQMPFYLSSDQEQVYYTLVHQKPFTGGFFNANSTQQYQYLQTALEYFPNEASVQILREYQVEYIVIDPSAYSDFAAIQNTLTALGLEPLTEQGGLWVYTFSD